MTTTVYDYFLAQTTYAIGDPTAPEQALATPTVPHVVGSDTYADVFRRMPLACNCGEDCAAVIDRAASLCGDVRDVFDQDKPEHFVAILTIACDVVACYIS